MRHRRSMFDDLPSLLLALVLCMGAKSQIGAWTAAPSLHQRPRGTQMTISVDEALTGKRSRRMVTALRLRGGSSTRKFMDASAYPLHGEGDTEGENIGDVKDPYSVAAVAAKPLGPTADFLEESYQEELRENPNNVDLLCSYANFLRTARGDTHRAAECAWRVVQLEPQHWWIQQHGRNYLPPHMLPTEQPAPREAYHEVPEPPPPPPVPEDADDRDLSFLQIMVREQEKLDRQRQQEQMMQAQQDQRSTGQAFTAAGQQGMAPGQQAYAAQQTGAAQQQGMVPGQHEYAAQQASPAQQPSMMVFQEQQQQQQQQQFTDPQGNHGSPSHAPPFGM